MLGGIKRLAIDTYERALERDITDPPRHVAVIQDGNRRYARKAGQNVTRGHREGAETSERILEWCRDVGVEELTLYAFSTENFSRADEEREALFDLLTEKLTEFADHPEIHENEVKISAIGERHLLPVRVRDAIEYAEGRTHGYDRFRLNIAVAYGGRAELLNAAQEIARRVDTGDFGADDVDVTMVESHLYDKTVTDVDLIIRTGGNERTSNFLPWHANGNEAAVYFCTPYWPEFTRREFLRAIRTYQYRRKRWRRTRLERALAVLRAAGERDLPRARKIVGGARSSHTEPSSGPAEPPTGDESTGRAD